MKCSRCLIAFITAMLAVLTLTVVTLLTAGHRPPGAAIYRAHEVLALCLEHAEQLPHATGFLLNNCRFLDVVERQLKGHKSQVVPFSQVQQAQRQTAGALLLVRGELDWPTNLWTQC